MPPWPPTQSHGPCLPQDLDGTGGLPHGRNSATTTFDVQSGLLLMAGGVMNQYACDQPAILWQWNGAAWKANPGQPRGQLVYDSTKHRTLALGDQTSAWDGRTWSPIAGPAPMGAAAFDGKRGQVVVYSDSGGISQTWLFDGSSWALARPAHQPPARLYAVAAWDGTSSQVVLWGGSLDGKPSQNRVAETWTWDGSDWANRTGAQAPPASEADSMSSGQSGVALYTVDATGTAQAWAFGGSAWTRLQASPPPARYLAAMAYDPNHQMLYLFGGERGACCGGKTNELWAYDGNTWRRISP
ncbi:MAG TPA: hypothetical protein VE953_17585 [Terriglobales bacterium]|nr:hypothetical protein [Terriglobales bacterium]